MKSGPLDQTRFKSGHQISQTSRLKRRLDLDRRIFCTNDLHHKISRRYIADISKISPIYRRYFRYIGDISPKKSSNFFPARVSLTCRFFDRYVVQAPIFRRNIGDICRFSTIFPANDFLQQKSLRSLPISDISPKYRPIYSIFQSLVIPHWSTPPEPLQVFKLHPLVSYKFRLPPPPPPPFILKIYFSCI